MSASQEMFPGRSKLGRNLDSNPSCTAISPARATVATATTAATTKDKGGPTRTRMQNGNMVI